MGALKNNFETRRQEKSITKGTIDASVFEIWFIKTINKKLKHLDTLESLEDKIHTGVAIKWLNESLAYLRTHYESDNNSQAI